MNIPVIEDKIILNNKREVMRLFLYIKLLEKGVKTSNTELNVLMELYEFGGYYNQEQETHFFTKCINSKFRTSDQSIRNVLTKFKNVGVVKKVKIHQRYISEEFLPKIDSQMVGLMFFVSNAN